MSANLQDVVKLRKLTGAGMMDCKKAIEEANGDIDRAVELIRERGKAIANKRADRIAAQGVIMALDNQDHSKAVLITVNCETDFVAKNQDFIALAKKIAQAALASNVSTLEELKALKVDDATAEELVTRQSGITGEKMELSFFSAIEAVEVACYNHPGYGLAAIAGFSKNLADHQVGFNIAMQVAGMNPVAIDADHVPQEIKDKEFEIGREQARMEGKPENMLDKIAQGRLQKFFRENTLLSQQYVQDEKLSVAQYIAQADKDLKVTAFARNVLTE